ncbi:phage tail assembly protein T [Moellerella wisconsensis]|uniref:phage tail assembly protein T n=2 Tax=Moellerella wisconsensis TaxID=158849 RepID=UPI0030761C65
MLRLAREFKRPDWRRMLSEMSASEFNDWIVHFDKTPFTPQLMDIEFAALHTSIYSAMCGAKTDIADFMLLTDVTASDDDMSDELIQSISESIPGGLRYEQANS